MLNSTVDAPVKAILKKHFFDVLGTVAKTKLIPEASYKNIEGVQRGVAGIPFHCYNFLSAPIGLNKEWDKFIQQQQTYFQGLKLPFAWYVDENEDLKLHDALKKKRFHNVGIFQGVIGTLENPSKISTLPKGYTLEKVKSKNELDEFCKCVGEVFALAPEAIQMISKATWEISNGQIPSMFNWVIKYNGEVVSTGSTFIQGPIVSFWNCATKEEHRRKGLCTSILQTGANEALQKECSITMCYLMSEALAAGICRKTFGMTPEWKYNAYFSP